MRVEYITAQQIGDSTFQAECPLCKRYTVIEKTRRCTKRAVSIEYKINFSCRHFLLFEPMTEVAVFGGGDLHAELVENF